MCQDLKDYFRKVGEVRFADAHRQRRGEGVVDFSSASEMKAAVKELDDTEIRGKRVKVREVHRFSRLLNKLD